MVVLVVDRRRGLFVIGLTEPIVGSIVGRLVGRDVLALTRVTLRRLVKVGRGVFFGHANYSAACTGSDSPKISAALR